MKVSFTTHDELFQGFMSSPSKDVFDLPAFEDAFDTVSLRKFYQEQESTDCQSTLNCKKDDSLFDDIDFGLEDHDLLRSPFNRSQYGTNIGTSPSRDPRDKLAFNLNVNRGNSYQEPLNVVNQTSPTISVFKPKSNENIQILMKSGNMFLSKKTGEGNDELIVKNQTQHKLQVVKGKSYDSASTEAEENFMVLLRSKKIFKIEKQAKQEKVVKSIRKKSSSAKDSKAEKYGSDEKQNVLGSLTGKNIVLNFNKAGVPVINSISN